jgi:hypothetical protein
MMMIRRVSRWFKNASNSLTKALNFPGSFSTRISRQS